MLEVNLATGNLVCSVSTGSFFEEGLAPHHRVSLVHNSQRANEPGDFTGGFDLGGGWNSNYGFSLSFPSTGFAELVLGSGHVVDFEFVGGVWVSEAGAYLSLEIEGAGWVVTDRHQWKWHLDSSGKLMSIESAAGNSYVVTWGGQGVSSAVEPSGRGSTFHYNGQGKLASVDFPTGTLWGLAYDPSGRLASVAHADYGTVSMEYDGSGRIEKFTDYEGYSWEFEYFGAAWPDRLKKITFPDQTEASIAYTGLIHRVITTVTGQRGEIWKSVHDVADSPALMARLDPHSNVSTYSFGADKLLRSYTNELGHEWTFDYDSLGNLMESTDPLLRTVSYVHDSLHRLKKLEIGGQTTHLLYADTDHETQPTSVVEPRDDQSIAATTALEYFGPQDGSTPGEWNGRLETLVDAEGVTTRFEFDSLGLLDKEFEGPPTGSGRLEAHFDGLIGPSYIDHGGMGYPAHFPAIPPLPAQVQGSMGWSVAPGGAWNWRGQYIARSFDVSVPIDSGAGWETSNVLRTYQRDYLGRVTQFTEQSEETTAHVSNQPASAPTRTLCVTYHDDDPDGATEVELQNGDRWIWRRDLAGRVTSVARDGGAGEAMVCSHTYFADGKLQSRTYADGTNTHFTYEDNDQVASIEHRQGSTVLLLLEYDYNGINLPVLVTESSASGTLVKEYGYDQRRRLVSESRDDGSTIELRSYRYDQVGNRIERLVKLDGNLQSKTTYHYDREDVATYQSDNNRLVWTETVDGVSQPIEKTWYFYDNPFGNISRTVTNLAGTTGFTSQVFVYTEHGQPWLFWEESWDDFGSGPINVVRGDVLEERADQPVPRLWRTRDPVTFEPSGTAEWSTQLPYISLAYSVDGATGAQTERIARLPGIGRRVGQAFTAELSDVLGSIRRTVRGSVVTEMDYLAFGESLDSTNEPYGFAGALGARRSFNGVDFGGGSLIQVGWRMHAPANGRFTMRDPSGINDGPNVYAFVHNAPTWLVDPTGQDVEPVSPGRSLHVCMMCEERPWMVTPEREGRTPVVPQPAGDGGPEPEAPRASAPAVNPAPEEPDPGGGWVGPPHPFNFTFPDDEYGTYGNPSPPPPPSPAPGTLPPGVSPTGPGPVW